MARSAGTVLAVVPRMYRLTQIAPHAHIEALRIASGLLSPCGDYVGSLEADVAQREEETQDMRLENMPVYMSDDSDALTVEYDISDLFAPTTVRTAR
jgi:hypothetical protein